MSSSSPPAPDFSGWAGARADATAFSLVFRDDPRFLRSERLDFSPLGSSWVLALVFALVRALTFERALRSFSFSFSSFSRRAFTKGSVRRLARANGSGSSL